MIFVETSNEWRIFSVVETVRVNVLQDSQISKRAYIIVVIY